MNKEAADLGAAYTWLVQLRFTGDYGGDQHVNVDDGLEAVRQADHLLRVAAAADPTAFAVPSAAPEDLQA